MGGGKGKKNKKGKGKAAAGSSAVSMVKSQVEKKTSDDVEMAETPSEDSKVVTETGNEAAPPEKQCMLDKLETDESALEEAFTTPKSGHGRKNCNSGRRSHKVDNSRVLSSSPKATINQDEDDKCPDHWEDTSPVQSSKENTNDKRNFSSSSDGTRPKKDQEGDDKFRARRKSPEQFSQKNRYDNKRNPSGTSRWDNDGQDRNSRGSNRDSSRDEKGGSRDKRGSSRDKQGDYSGRRSNLNRSIEEAFNQFKNAYVETSADSAEFTKICEQSQDLFTAPNSYSLAHCVAEDLRMSSGIAVRFREVFGRVSELFKHRPKVGSLVYLKDLPNRRFIYYLVTKSESSGKPTYLTLFSSLYKLREHIKHNSVENLAIPRIGCGLDRLYWPKVKSMIEFLFKSVEHVEILVCNINQDYNNQRNSLSKIYLDPPYEKNDEYCQFKLDWDQGQTFYDANIREMQQDLFKMDEAFSLAHCVAEDMGMGSGIAVEFRSKFRKVDELLNQQQEAGGLAVLKDKERYVYYLVTKEISQGKPTYFTLFKSLQKMKIHIVENGVKFVAMPKIGCGLDRLDWRAVTKILEFLFHESDVEVVVCDFQPAEGEAPPRPRTCKVVNAAYPIEKIEEGTIIIYLLTESVDHVPYELKKMDDKFRIRNDIQDLRKRKVGQNPIISERRDLNYVLVGCTVRKTEKDQIDFVAFNKCLGYIQKKYKDSAFLYVGFEAIEDAKKSTNHKLCNLLKHTLRDVSVYFCWPENLKGEMPHTNLDDSFTSQSGSQNPSSSDWRNDSSNQRSVLNSSQTSKKTPKK